MRKRAEGLSRDIPALFLALKSPRTPFLAKLLAFLAVSYALSPIDLIPDFLPVIGYLDDLLLLPLLVVLAVKLIPKDVFEECRGRAEGLWKDGKAGKWYYSLPVVAVYAVLIYLVVKAVLRLE